MSSTPSDQYLAALSGDDEQHVFPTFTIPSQPQLTGNFYEETDVYRSAESFAFPPQSQLSGDFYCHAERDVFRSVAILHSGTHLTEKPDVLSSIPSSAIALEEPSGGKIDYFCSSSWQLDSPALEGSRKHVSSGSGSGTRDRFQHGQQPPDVPTDPFFTLAITTLKSTSSPCVIGNKLLDFFEVSNIAQVTKLKTEKYSMKVNVFVDSRTCEAKIRIYRDGDVECAVEFQRRQGDVMVFNRFYQEASRQLDNTSKCDEATAPSLSFAPPSIPDTFEVDLSQDQLRPLYEFACQDNTSLKAEAAVALAGFAKDKAVAPLLWSASCQEVLIELLRCDAKEVAYPTACALRNLAEHVHDAGEDFHGQLSQSLLQAFHEALRDSVATKPVHEELREAGMAMTMIAVC